MLTRLSTLPVSLRRFNLSKKLQGCSTWMDRTMQQLFLISMFGWHVFIDIGTCLTSLVTKMAKWLVCFYRIIRKKATVCKRAGKQEVRFEKCACYVWIDNSKRNERFRSVPLGLHELIIEYKHLYFRPKNKIILWIIHWLYVS